MVFLSGPATPHIFLGLAVFLVGVGDAFGAAAAGAIMPSLVPDEKLPAANVARNIVVRTSTIIGPGIGGVSVYLIGGRLTFFITAFTFALGTYFLNQIKEEIKSEPKERETFFTEMREGLRTVIEIPWIGAMIFMVSFHFSVWTFE